ncbi:MAG: hypothetical protein IPI49_32845 [Myxococcales bacterium]|nr:hypothetical protein [Myxococcales bacterium]HRC56738.1 hypothetical protein [Kofleriaceae bacterium]
MRWVARVLYENHRNEEKGFNLHQLVCAMVDDELGRSPFTTKNLVHCMTRKGVDKLLADCADRAVFDGLADSARFAVVDGDELHRRLGLSATCLLSEVRSALPQKYPGVHFAIPDAPTRAQSNTEHLLRCVAGCLGLPDTDDTLVSALRKGSNARTDRDRVFGRALGEAHRSARDCVRQAQPPIDELVRKLAAVVRPHLPAA